MGLCRLQTAKFGANAGRTTAKMRESGVVHSVLWFLGRVFRLLQEAKCVQSVIRVHIR
jgi:hypothetical protein